MKTRFLNLALVFACIALLCSCDSSMLSGKPGSSGKTQEVMIVANNSVYGGHTRMVLDSIFSTPQEVLPQPEPRFEMVQIAPSSFNGNTMFQSHRNILILEVDPQGQNKIFMEKNKWAEPQVVFRFTAKDRNALDSMLLVTCNRLLDEYYNMEYVRMERVFSQTPNVKVNRRVKEKFGFSLTFPEEFAMAKDLDNFMWVRKEAKDFGLQVYIAVVPSKDNSTYEEEGILKNLDTIMKRYVPCPAEGSYQGTERRDFFITRNVKIGDVDAIETRGLWRCYNDIMGGPFVCYTIPAQDKSQAIMLVGCVYSPSQRSKMVMKRDLLMQVDGICRSFKY